MQNIEVRNAIKNSGLKYWQVADALNVSDSTFTKWLRKELDPEKKVAVLKAIDTLKGEQ